MLKFDEESREHFATGLKNQYGEKIVISGKYNGFEVTTIEYEAFTDNKYIRYIELSSSITPIFDGSFKDCCSFGKINLSNG